jgi:LysM domain
MRSGPPIDSIRRLVSVFVLCGTFLMNPGCSTAPFQSAAQSGSPKLSRLDQKGAPIDDSGWPGSMRSGASDRPTQYHEVRAGESLASLAKMYGLSATQLVNANSLNPDDSLKPGQILKIPQIP